MVGKRDEKEKQRESPDVTQDQPPPLQSQARQGQKPPGGAGRAEPDRSQEPRVFESECVSAVHASAIGVSHRRNMRLAVTYTNLV